MKSSTTSLLLISLLAVSATAQNGAPGAREHAAPLQRGEASMARIMSGGDLEQSPLLRMLDNPRIAETLQLTDEQRTRLTEALTPFDQQLEEIGPKLEEAIKVQTGLLGENKVEQEALMQAVDAAWKLRTEVAKIQTRKLLALRSALTDEQLEKVKEMMMQRRRTLFHGRSDHGEGDERGPREGGERRVRPEGGMRGPRGDRRPSPAAPRGAAAVLEPVRDEP